MWKDLNPHSVLTSSADGPPAMATIRRLAASTLLSTIFRRSTGRCFTSAGVKAMRDFGDEWLDDDTQRRRKESEAVMDSDGLASGKGVQWVVIGEPGADKHVYGYRLSKLLKVPYISIGSLVRQELSPRSMIYKQISNALNQGKLVPEDVIFGLLSNRLVDGLNKGESGFVLDGLPRSRYQADTSLITPTSRGCTWNEKLCHHSAQVKELEDYYKKQMKLLSFQVASAPAETWQGLISALCLKHINAARSTTSSKLME